MNLFPKQKDKLTVGYQRRPWGGRWRQWGVDKLGAWVSKIQTTLHKTGKQQGPAVEHRELYSVPCNNLEWKRIGKRIYIYIYLNHFAVQHNSVNQLYFN